MPTVSLYIRETDLKLWLAVTNKSEWVSHMLRGDNRMLSESTQSKTLPNAMEQPKTLSKPVQDSSGPRSTKTEDYA